MKITITTQRFNSSDFYKKSPIKNTFNYQLTFGNSIQKRDEFIKRLHETDDEDERTNILKEFLKYQQSEIEKNKNNLMRNRAKLQEAIATSFRPSEYYSPEIMKYAKNYLGKENWEEDLRKWHMRILSDRMNCFKYIFTSAPEKETEQVIRKVRHAMIDLNNQKIRELQLAEKKASKKQKQLETELKKKEAERNERLRKEQLDAKIKDKLTTNFVNLIKTNSEQTPTVVMIEGTEQDRRKEIFNWLHDEVDARTVSFALPSNEDDALYRLNTELQYAQENYEKNGKRTVLFIEDFSHILKSSEVTNETIAEMKAFLFSLSEDKEPLTIVFKTPNSSNIDSAFLKNKRRIPLKINIDDLTLGQKKDWKLHLDPFIANMSQQRLEIHKCWYTERAEEAAKKEDYREVVRLKETLAMICEMQGKERDAYLLRCDIENYLKRI